MVPTPPPSADSRWSGGNSLHPIRVDPHGERFYCAEDPQLESRPTFLFFKGAASGLFAAGAEELRKGVDDRQALLIGIRCERGSHQFFKRYGERFEDSEGKQVFLEFADEERAHHDLLLREYRALLERQKQQHRPTRTRRASAR